MALFVRRSEIIRRRQRKIQKIKRNISLVLHLLCVLFFVFMTTRNIAIYLSYPFRTNVQVINESHYKYLSICHDRKSFADNYQYYRSIETTEIKRFLYDNNWCYLHQINLVMKFINFQITMTKNSSESITPKVYVHSSLNGPSVGQVSTDLERLCNNETSSSIIPEIKSASYRKLEQHCFNYKLSRFKSRESCVLQCSKSQSILNTTSLYLARRILDCSRTCPPNDCEQTFFTSDQIVISCKPDQKDGRHFSISLFNEHTFVDYQLSFPLNELFLYLAGVFGCIFGFSVTDLRHLMHRLYGCEVRQDHQDSQRGIFYLKMCFFLCCLTLCGYQIKNVITEYLEYKSTHNVYIGNPTVRKLPAVSWCSSTNITLDELMFASIEIKAKGKIDSDYVMSKEKSGSPFKPVRIFRLNNNFCSTVKTPPDHHDVIIDIPYFHSFHKGFPNRSDLTIYLHSREDFPQKLYGSHRLIPQHLFPNSRGSSLQSDFEHSSIRLLAAPFKSDCIDYKQLRFNSRDHCINNCLVDRLSSCCHKFPLAVVLPNSVGNYSLPVAKTSQKIINYCRHKCQQLDCLLDVFKFSRSNWIPLASDNYTLIFHSNEAVYSTETANFTIATMIIFMANLINFWFGWYLWQPFNLISVNGGTRSAHQLVCKMVLILLIIGCFIHVHHQVSLYLKYETEILTAIEEPSGQLKIPRFGMMWGERKYIDQKLKFNHKKEYFALQYHWSKIIKKISYPIVTNIRKRTKHLVSIRSIQEIQIAKVFNILFHFNQWVNIGFNVRWRKETFINTNILRYLNLPMFEVGFNMSKLDAFGTWLMVGGDMFDPFKHISLCKNHGKIGSQVTCTVRLSRTIMKPYPYNPYCVNPPGGDQNACLYLCLTRNVTEFRNPSRVQMSDDPVNLTRSVIAWPYHYFDDPDDIFINCVRQCRQLSCLTESFRVIGTSIDHDSSRTLSISRIQLDIMSVETKFIAKLGLLQTIIETGGVIALWFGCSVLHVSSILYDRLINWLLAHPRAAPKRARVGLQKSIIFAMSWIQIIS